MTRHELIDAYVRGRIDRRDFVRRLTALGVSASAALAYAHSLAPSARASGGRNEAGFIVRTQADDGEYGTACSFTDDDEALLTALAGQIDVIQIFVTGLSDFTADDFDPGVYDELSSIRDLLLEQADALAAAGTEAAESALTPSYGSPEEFIAAAADGLNALASLYAGVAPAIVDGETRQTVTSIATVIGRFAAYVNVVNGDSPAPSAFDQPSCAF